MSGTGIGIGGKIVMTLIAIVGLAAGPVLAASSDLSSSATGPSMVETGAQGTITVAYGNAGPDPATSAYCNLAFPAGVPAAFDQITQQQFDFIEASATDTAGNTPLLFMNDGCDALLIQNQGPGAPPQIPIQGLTVGASESFSISTEFPMSADMLASGLRIDDPPAIAGVVTTLGRGTCTDCNDPFNTCFGGPLAGYDLGSLPVELVDDGSGSPTLACQPFTMVTAGAIAVIDRGTCAYGDKVYNAEAAGAAGVIVANDGNCLIGPPSPDCVNNMLPGNLGLQTSIPVVQVSQNQGSAIKDELLTGPVMATVGGIHTTDAVFTSQIFLVGTGDSDPDGANDASTWTTAVVQAPVFADGFESGDTSAWSSSVPGD